MSDEEVRRLRDEVTRLKTEAEVRLTRQAQNARIKGETFNELYYIVTHEYENWDEGRTVDWEAVQHACSLMVSAIRRGQKD
jgi:hypothetical protein